jgi:hypothetical protein
MGEDHMTVLRPRPVNATMFHWHADTRTYSIDMSTLGDFGRVYDDACDEGLTLIERHGLREVVCVVDREDVVDGEIKGWWLKPLKYSGPSFKILVVNT